ncbi:MAG TPA: heme ABC exporter ATP-binding protein CcmA [Alphaproteobacteria bacterium]|nr:heme ABC exporter ATP-binding protein CcmA [Alphaproteobacteria bacterium]
MFSSSFLAEMLGGARNGFWLFEELSFRLTPGEVLLITGPNGAGKSTLLRILAGLLPPAEGRAGFEAREPSVEEGPRRHYLGHANAIKVALTVEQNLGFWASLAGQDKSTRAAALNAALEAFDLMALRDLPARVLSAGQKRRLALSRLIASPAALWLLDEPTTALDAASTRLFEQAVTRHRNAGGLAVIATHQSLTMPGAQRRTLGEVA